MNATMLRIESEEENEIMKQFFIYDNHHFQSSSEFVRLDSNYEANSKRNWYWSNGQLIRFKKWTAGEPHLNNNYSCLGWNHTGFWFDLFCRNHSNIIAACQKTSATAKYNAIKIEEKFEDIGLRIRDLEREMDSMTIRIKKCDCPDGWHQLYEKCVWIGQHMSHDNSNKYCSRMNATMLQIESETENALIEQLLNKKYRFTPFIYFRMDSKYKENRAKQWYWSDGTKITYFKWAQNKPTFGDTQYSCLGMNQTGYWFNVLCDENNQLYVVCQKIIYSATCDNTTKTLFDEIKKLRKMNERFISDFTTLFEKAEYKELTTINSQKVLNKQYKVVINN
ncbi:Macrophage mannose receptor 1-like protein [Leptotrombidium deliense]|uniref:Macrophage mannose receptor 1-like protein n=1 Tax=Leptotrombidium deliense TaxID=299467 RepID=A0A443SC10_9ACAR|nr:Macrophage mannose receptor 1-like protein [Leptotrombidium deliense]